MGTTTRNNTSAFDSALRRGVVPRFNYIVPNDCENGHDPCGSRPIGQYDRFVSREVAKIKASPAYGPRSVIVVTWDEQGDATPHNARVGSLWIGPHVKARNLPRRLVARQPAGHHRTRIRVATARRRPQGRADQPNLEVIGIHNGECGQ